MEIEDPKVALGAWHGGDFADGSLSPKFPRLHTHPIRMSAADIEVGLDNTIAIMAVSPELNDLLMRAKAIFANLGGKMAATTMESAKSFDGKRLVVVAQMRALDRVSTLALTRDAQEFVM